MGPYSTSSPAPALQVEMDGMPSEMRRTQLRLIYRANLRESSCSGFFKTISRGGKGTEEEFWLDNREVNERES